MTACADPSFALDLTVDRQGMTRHRVAFPWSLGRSYRCEDRPGAHRLVPQVAGAGLLSGDRVRQRLKVGEGARLRVESAGAMQVLAGDLGPACSEWHYILGPGAMLVLDAEPYALMPHAALDLRSRVDLAPGAVFLAADMLCHGHHDPDGLGHWTTETRVTHGVRGCAFIDRQSATASGNRRLFDLPCQSMAFGTIWLLADQDMARAAMEYMPLGDGPAAVTDLRGRSGCAIRLIAPDGGVLRRLCRTVLRGLESRLDALQAASS